MIGKEQFCEAISTDRETDQLNQKKIRSEEILDQVVEGRRFKWSETDIRRARKERMRCFESNLFVDRISKQLNWTENNLRLFLRSSKSVNMSFQYRIRNRFMYYN
jgi:hypothetical protein